MKNIVDDDGVTDDCNILHLELHYKGQCWNLNISTTVLDCKLQFNTIERAATLLPLEADHSHFGPLGQR